nr:hypothetical protein [Tanacetum cinerariifolium]
MDKEMVFVIYLFKDLTSTSVTTAPLNATHADLFGDEAKVDMSNISITYLVPSTQNTRIHEDHSLDHVIGDVQSCVQTRRMTKTTSEQGFISVVYEGKTHKDLYTCLFACFLSQEEPKKVIQALKDPRWIKALQEELLQFKLQQVWTLVDLPYGRRAIGTKWIYKNKKDNRGLQVTQKDDGISISQDKYVDEILKKFGFLTVKTASTHMETSKPLLNDAEAEDVDVHLYRSMIGSLMYLTASRYLKGQPKFGLRYPKDSPFDLKAYIDNDYAGASLDRKSTTGEYVAAISCCGQVLWIQNQMLDYGHNFMNIKIFTDNESTICIVKNPVFHSKTKHIEIQHHFIIDANEKKLIQMIKIHTDQNVTNLLTKAFDVGIFQNQVTSIGMLNL